MEEELLGLSPFFEVGVHTYISLNYSFQQGRSSMEVLLHQKRRKTCSSWSLCNRDSLCMDSINYTVIERFFFFPLIMSHFLLRKQANSENIHSFWKENTFQPNCANTTAGSINYTEIFCLQSLLKSQNTQNCYPHDCCLQPSQRNTFVRRKGWEKWKGLVGIFSK